LGRDQPAGADRSDYRWGKAEKDLQRFGSQGQLAGTATILMTECLNRALGISSGWAEKIIGELRA
jgi:hypothetical protein